MEFKKYKVIGVGIDTGREAAWQHVDEGEEETQGTKILPFHFDSYRKPLNNCQMCSLERSLCAKEQIRETAQEIAVT